MEVRATITTDPTDTGQSSSRVFCETIFRQPNPGQCPGVFFGDADLLNVRYRHVADNPTTPQETEETRHEAQTSQTESEDQNVTAVPRDRGGECFGRRLARQHSAAARVQFDRDGPGLQIARHQRRLGGVYERSKYNPRSFPGA